MPLFLSCHQGRKIFLLGLRPTPPLWEGLCQGFRRKLVAFAPAAWGAWEEKSTDLHSPSQLLHIVQHGGRHHPYDHTLKLASQFGLQVIYQVLQRKKAACLTATGTQTSRSPSVVPGALQPFQGTCKAKAIFIITLRHHLPPHCPFLTPL